MTSDLEEKLRAVLHERGAAITADRLRPADSPRPSETAWMFSAGPTPERRTRSWGTRLAPILAAAAVAGLVVSLALVLGVGSRPSRPAGGQSHALTGVLGRTWALKTVQAPDGTTTAISPSIGAGVTFLGTGDRIEFQDGLAVFQAYYTQTANGQLRVHGVSGAHSDYRGHDREQLAAIAGVDAIGVPIHAFAPPPVRVELVSGRLQITTQGYQLSFDDPVPVAPSASQLPPSPPADVTTTAAHASSAQS